MVLYEHFFNFRNASHKKNERAEWNILDHISGFYRNRDNTTILFPNGPT